MNVRLPMKINARIMLLVSTTMALTNVVVKRVLMEMDSTVKVLNAIHFIQNLYS